MIFSHIIEKCEVKLLGFKKMRERSGITQHELAKKLGVDQSTVCLWETGKTQPRAKLLTKIAEIFGCTIDELLTATPTE